MQLDLAIGADHVRSHPPGPEDDRSWQESWAFAIVRSFRQFPNQLLNKR